MAPWIVCALCALVIIKPQEFIPALNGLPLLYIAFVAAAVAVVFDVCWRRIRPVLAPQLPWALAFFVWTVLTTALKYPQGLETRVMPLVITLGVCVAVAVGTASSRGVLLYGVMFLCCGLLVTAVGIAQSVAPYQCMVGAPDDWQGKGELKPDGRACVTELECLKNAPDPKANYFCERAGPLGTSTVEGRVRYRGSLEDPNELALMTAMSIPFAFALADRSRARRREKKAAPTPRRQGSWWNTSASAREGAGASARVSEVTALSLSPRPTAAARATAARLPLLLTDRLIAQVSGVIRAIPVAAIMAAIGMVVVLSRSRTGLIVYLLVLGLYFVKRNGAWAIVVGCLVAPPMILLGGRSGAEAEESAGERTELLFEAFQMIRQTKGIGVGLGQFVDESSFGLTAHNSYLLAAAEAGLVGLCLFGIVLYAAAKVPLCIWFGDYKLDNTVRRFAPAVFVSLCGALAGIFFLSWTYKDLLYMTVGASAALYGAARREDERVSVRVSLKEVVLVCVGMMAMLIAVNVALRILT